MNEPNKCHDCARVVPPEDTHTRCEVCRRKACEYMKSRYAERDRTRCFNCGVPLPEGETRAKCEACRRKDAERVRRYRERQKLVLIRGLKRGEKKG